MKKIVVFLMMIGLGFFSRGVAAQDLFESQTLGQLPDMMLPEPTDNMSSGGNYLTLPEETASSMPAQESLAPPITSADLNASESYSSADQEFEMFECTPAALESSGTWLRRGFWFAEIDAVLYRRSFDHSGVGLMIISSGSVFPGFFVHDNLSIDGDSDAETTPRLKVGRFLFRDQTNRDHNLEFIAFGGSNFSQDQRLTGDTLIVPSIISGANESFSGATDSQYSYDSFFNSFELNYHVNQRMLKDRMELEPSGHWVRRAQPSRSLSYLAGLRYFNMNEHLKWDAFGIPDVDDDNADETGEYDIETGNHLIGTQLGFGSAYETARWSLGAKIKGGMYLNMADLDSDFSVTGNLTSGRTDLQGDRLSYIGEGSLYGKYHIRPNFSLRVAMEVMHVTSMALAPNQIDFIPSGSLKINQSGEPVFLGGSIGFESYW